MIQLGTKKNNDCQTIDWVGDLSEELTQRKLKSLFDYNAETGDFIKRSINKPVGSLDKSTGYIRYKLNGKNHRVHRLIWLWLHGSIPDDCFIDHLDNDRTNNKANNLRLLPQQGNAENITKGNKNNKIGIRGVSELGSGLYIARITSNGKTITLGTFTSAELAGQEYFKQKELLHSGWSRNGI